MINPEIKTFGHWIINHMAEVQITSDEAAQELGYPEGRAVRLICDNRAALPMKDWPALARILRIRFDELLIVLSHFHPEWVADYAQFVSNALRYLLWRIEQTPLDTRGLCAQMGFLGIEELIEPACNGQWMDFKEKRKQDRRSRRSGTEDEKRATPRRIADLIRYLKNELGGAAIGVIVSSILGACAFFPGGLLS